MKGIQGIQLSLPWAKAGMVTIKFESELASFQENLNQVSSVSLLMTASTALASGVSLSLAETTKEPGRSQVKKLKLRQNFGLLT